MIRSMVGSAFAGFQKAAVSGDYDEREIQLNNLRVDLRNLEGIVRQLMVELAATRQELQALKAQGVVAAPAPAPVVEPVKAEPVKAEPPKAEAKRSKKEAAKAEPPKAEAVVEPVKVEAPKPAAVVEPVKVEAPKPAPVVEPVKVEAPKPAAVVEAPKPEAAKVEAPAAPQTSSFAALAAMAAAGGLKETRHADDSSTDLEGYRERMRANGREVTLATVGINYTADGVPFIGPVDNESSRAKAAGKVLTIDQWECISCGTCVEQTADVFTLPGEAKAEVLKQEGPMDLIQDAIDACPVTCISWIEREQLAEQHSAGGVG
ncbi:ferredoxin [Myxococcota bacterium]|nr:ferredoxin [Myxococcota bacterium]